MDAISTAYFDRFGFSSPSLSVPPEPSLGLVVTIPCYDEPNLLDTLASLAQCTLPECGVEILVIVNAAADASSEVVQRSETIAREAKVWMDAHNNSGMRFHLLVFPALPPKHAGVGLARKIVMDEAAERLHRIGNPNGVISGLDADCRVASNYLVALENHFQSIPETIACSIRFEHLPDEAQSPQLRAGILHYELYLRYVVAGLRWARHPHGFHTVGSSMAVRAGSYFAQGGMNRRQAGEDFYFLSKLMTLGSFSALECTTVYPSPRPSHRVPFGTGKALRNWMEKDLSELDGEAFEVFRDIRIFLENLRKAPPNDRAHATLLLESLPPAIQAFLRQSDFESLVESWRANTASEETFLQRCLSWFDRFRVLKFTHFANDHHYLKQPVLVSALQLLEQQDISEVSPDVESLLQRFRELDDG